MCWDVCFIFCSRPTQFDCLETASAFDLRDRTTAASMPLSKAKPATDSAEKSFKRRERRLSKDADPHALSEDPASNRGGDEILLMAGEVGDSHNRDNGVAKSAISNTHIVGAYSCHGMNHSRPKANQDCGCVAHPLGGDEAAVLLAVFDGHGSEGTAVSQHILKAMHSQLDASIGAEKVRHDPAAALTAAFTAVQADVVKLSKQRSTSVDGSESGACSLVAYLRERTLWVANAGDCVAVLARVVMGSGGGGGGDGGAAAASGVKSVTDKAARMRLDPCGGRFSAIKLSTEHKPNLPSERKRIESMGGWVRETEIEEDTGELLNPSRMYRERGEANRHKGPGLAISRSIGDLNATRCGMSAEPEVVKHELRSTLPRSHLSDADLPKTAEEAIATEAPSTPSGDGADEDAFLILASDGVWEFLTAQDAVDIVAPVYARGGKAMDACKALIDRAKAEWLENEGDCYRDDITALVVFLPLLLQALAAGRPISA